MQMRSPGFKTPQTALTRLEITPDCTDPAHKHAMWLVISGRLDVKGRDFRTGQGEGVA